MAWYSKNTKVCLLVMNNPLRNYLTALVALTVVIGGVSWYSYAASLDSDADGLLDLYDPSPNNIDGDGDGIFDTYDYDPDGDATGVAAISADTDSDGVADDADADDVYPSATIAAVTTSTVGVGGDYTNFSDYMNISAKSSSATDGGIFFAGENSGAYVVPTTAEQAIFNEVIDHMDNRDLSAVLALIDDMNGDGNDTGGDDYDYDLVHFVEQTTSSPVTHDVYCLVEESASPAGRGIYCVNYAAEHNHHMSVPHPTFDTGTDAQGADAFWETPMRYLSMSTTGRCSNGAYSACDGTTSVCGVSEKFRESDMAHVVDAYFGHAHGFRIDKNK
ncbi:MAG: hypothetical protein AAFQ07_14205, partial [Chloroflexota bacterium]